jgi:predicted acetyltransferase
MDIRAATLNDVSLLAKLNQQLQIDEAHRLRLEIPELERRMAGWLTNDGYEAVLFDRDGEVIGYALFRRETEHIYLRQFFVCRDVRRKGIGRQAIQWLSQNVWSDAPRVRVDVLINNQPGIGFWRAVGFRDYCLTMELQQRK